MVNASADIQTDLSSGSLLCRSICHSSEAQSSIIRISSPSPTCLGHGCSKHKLVLSHCLYLPSHGSPPQGDPCQAKQLPDHCNVPRLGYSPFFFTGIVPKVPGMFQMEPFLVLLNELTKAPFEPMKDTDLKHLTLKLLSC